MVEESAESIRRGGKMSGAEEMHVLWEASEVFDKGILCNRRGNCVQGGQGV